MGTCCVRPERHFNDCFRTERFNTIDLSLKSIRNQLMAHNHIFRMHAENNISIWMGVVQGFRKLLILNRYRIVVTAIACQSQAKLAISSGDVRRDAVHTWIADEAGDKEVYGVVIDVSGCAELLDFACLKDSNPIRHRHGFNLIVRHIERGCAEVALPPTDFGAHFGAEFRIKVGDGFVHEEHLWTADHRPAETNPLRFTAAQLIRCTHE